MIISYKSIWKVVLYSFLRKLIVKDFQALCLFDSKVNDHVKKT